MNTFLREHFKVLLRNHVSCPYHLAKEPSESDEQRIVKAVNDALKNVPHYKDYPRHVSSLKDISQLPIITKRDILQAPDKSFLNRNASKFLTMKKETGGTSGFSLRVYRRPIDMVHYMQVVGEAFSHIGKNLRVAQLRGEKPTNGDIAQKVGPTLVMSSYKLCEENLDSYVQTLKKYHISCLHVYPSSIVILARLLKKKYGVIQLPELKGIMASSEIFAVEDKKLVKEVFGDVVIVDFYGQNELCCAAMAVDFQPFKFFQDYGYVEYVEDQLYAPAGNKIAQIVATSVMNKTMPIIRYATEDHVELDDNGDVKAIIGRTSDFVVNKRGQLVPCIFVNRDISFRHVVNFQYYQDIPGKLVFRIVSDGLFDKEDEENVLFDLQQSFMHMDTEVELVDSIEKTKIGKQKRLIQLLDLSQYQ